LGISPYELLYGTPPRAQEQDVLLQLGRRVGLERIYYLQSKRFDDDLHQLQDHYRTKVESRPRFNPGDKVLRVHHVRSNKMSPTFQPSPYLVVAMFNNNTCKLADADGKLLKRHVNTSHLRRFYSR
jgi:hypothetical protein